MRLRRPNTTLKPTRVTITFQPDVWKLIRSATRVWRQSPKTFIRLAIEFRAADVLNSLPSIPLGAEDMVTFRRIWDLSRDPGPPRKRERGDWTEDSTGDVSR